MPKHLTTFNFGIKNLINEISEKPISFIAGISLLNFLGILDCTFYAIGKFYWNSLAEVLSKNLFVVNFPDFPQNSFLVFNASSFNFIKQWPKNGSDTKFQNSGMFGGEKWNERRKIFSNSPRRANLNLHVLPKQDCISCLQLDLVSFHSRIPWTEEDLNY